MQRNSRRETYYLGKQEEHLTNIDRKILIEGCVPGPELLLCDVGDGPGGHLQELRHAPLHQLHGHDGGAGARVSLPRL